MRLLTAKGVNKENRKSELQSIQDSECKATMPLRGKRRDKKREMGVLRIWLPLCSNA